MDSAPDRRPEPPMAASERDTLVGFVQFLRETVAQKAAGFSAEQLRTTLPPSTMTLGGMLTHLAYVEDYWLGYIFLGNEPAEPWASAPFGDDNDWDWHLAERIDADDARGMWREAVTASDNIIAGRDLDELSVREAHGERCSLRFILTHFIEEYARHAGHADLIAESLDGRTGE